MKKTFVILFLVTVAAVMVFGLPAPAAAQNDPASDPEHDGIAAGQYLDGNMSGGYKPTSQPVRRTPVGCWMRHCTPTPAPQYCDDERKVCKPTPRPVRRTPTPDCNLRVCYPVGR
jgi:hypothetical protein